MDVADLSVCSKGTVLKNLRNASATVLLVVFSVFGTACQVNGQPIFNEAFLDSVTGDPETTELTLAVRNALERNAQTANHRIVVSLLSDDNVKLVGYVPDDATYYEAERVAGRVDGVRLVTNNLNIRR